MGRRHPFRWVKHLKPRTVEAVKAVGWFGLRHGRFKALLAERCGLSNPRAAAMLQWHHGARYFTAEDDQGATVFVKTGGPEGTIAREGGVLARLSGCAAAAHLPRVRALLPDGPFPLVVLDHVDGVPLDRLMDQGLNDLQRATLVDQMQSLLQALHGAGLVHRDVRPGNLLVESRDGAPHLVLIDFALAVTPGSDELPELDSLRRSPRLHRGLGMGWNPEPLVWDDAHSFREIVRAMGGDGSPFDEHVARLVFDGRGDA